MRTVRPMESFYIHTQKHCENEMSLLLERNSILQGMFTMVALWVICLYIINVHLLLAVGHSNNDNNNIKER